MEIEQTKADEYLSALKKFKKMREINLNQPFDFTESLYSDIHGDIFKFDARQGRIELSVGSLNTRAHDCIVLARLCLGKDKVHKNPDGIKVIGPHIHIYKEKYGDKIVYPAKDYGFDKPEDFLKSIKRFCEFCNISGSNFTMQELI